jgi:hypothetical protein
VWAVKPEVARGPGPTPVRIAIAVIAGIYLVLLVIQPAQRGWKSPIAYFTTCTGLFPQADWVGSDDASKQPGAKEFRIEAWSCERTRWEAFDPQPYFPIQADDKESRLPRMIHFYIELGATAADERATAHALEDFLFQHHDDDGADDGVPGTLGGIRLSRVATPFGAVGDTVARYRYEPLAPVPADAHVTVLYQTQQGDHDGHVGIKSRCKGAP